MTPLVSILTTTMNTLTMFPKSFAKSKKFSLISNLALCTILLALVGSTRLTAQSNTAGDIVGTITDPQGAVVSNARVEAANAATGLHQATLTSNNGTFRIPLLPPGEYKVTITSPGFQTVETIATVVIGGTAETDIKLPVKTQSTQVEVVSESATVQTENGDIQSVFNTKAIQNLPNPGGDITFYAQLAPGAVMNTNGGYGNFSVFGLPGTSNLFTLNGQNDNDPFLNLNNSGATNLLLGANELSEVSVTTNGYSAQYGQLAGASVNYVTKAGTNAFHGNAKYYWDGRVMNANDFFNNANGVPRQFVNANQWATSVGGPIIKDKTFFFVNYEALRVVLPTSTSLVRLPSQAFESATLANLVATGEGGEVPFYNQLFKAYNSASGFNRASAVPYGDGDVNGPGCGDLTILPAGKPCAVQYSAAPNAFAHEYQVAVRIDQTLGNNDRLFGRYQTDQGVQPTYTDAVNTTQSATSIQPEYQGQLNWTHIFGPSATNQMVGSALYYNAPFGAANPAAANAILPYFAATNDGSFASLNTIDTFTPQGREVMQFQVVDDFSLTKGIQTIKIGMNYHRDLVNDYDFGQNTGGELVFGSIDDMYNGVLGQYGAFAQNFPAKLSQDIRTYQLGMYVEDDLRVSSKLKVNLSLRVDHNSNPICKTNCFASSNLPFNDLTHNENTPYNAVIKTGLHQAYPATDGLIWEPRIGFAYSPFGTGKTVIRGGAGIFGDSFPATVVDQFAENIPQYNSIALQGQAGYNNTPVASGVPGSVFGIASAANSALNSAFASGGTLNSISASNPLFSVPNLFTSDKSIRQPRYYEWNIEVQHQLPWSVLLSANYVGNRGVHEAIENSGLNGFCAGCASNFTAYSSNPIDPRFNVVTQIQSSGESRYNGLVLSARKTLSEHVQFNFNYTYSHSLDDVSNGGILGFNSNTLSPVDPFNIRAYNYGSSDYDVRHYISASYVLDDVVRGAGFHKGPNAIFGGWTLSGTIFHRTGFPFSVTDSSTNLAGDGGTVFAYSTTKGRPSCGASAVYTNNTPCLAASDFGTVIDPNSGLQLGFGNQSRNQYRGPGYFNTDFNVLKAFTIRENAKLRLGLQFFNLFNHPNFAPPVSNIENPEFGQVTSTVNVPTSILGSFLGGDASPRLIQLHGEFTF